MKSALLRQEFRDLPKHINWFPGHMHKAMNQLQEEIKRADMFIEVRDARMPITSHNPELMSLIPQQKKRIVVINKLDIANENKTLSIIKQMREQDKNMKTILISTKNKTNVSKLLKFIQDNVSPQFKTVGAWIMIGGIPNVGKSTIINSLRKKDEDLNQSKKSGAHVGGDPCITKSISGFKIMSDPPTYILDTPGIIIPKIKDETEDGLKLCVCNNIRSGIVEQELVCDYLLYKLNKEQNFTYVNRYLLAMRRPTDNVHDLLTALMHRYKLQDRNTASDLFLRDFRDGLLGRITLDDPTK